MTEKKVATMRLVDVDKIEPHEQLESLGNGQYEYVRVAYMDDIDALPTVDAVPVVRCKDCLHNRACEIQYHAQAGDLFFCGAAERKDGDDGKAD